MTKSIGRVSPDILGKRWLPAIIAVAVTVVYLNSFSGTLLYDDLVQIPANPRIQQLWPLSLVLSGRRPIVDLSLAVNYALGGLSLWGYHAFNLTVHLLAALTLYGVVRRTLLGAEFRGRFGRAAGGLAASVALVWAVHPLQTQSVTYVIQRGESMMGLFYLLTLYCVIRGTGSPRRCWWFSAAVGACALGMGCKAVMLSAPIFVLLYDRAFLARSWGGALRRRWALYLGLGAAWSVLALSGVVQGVLQTTAGRHTAVGLGFKGITPWEYLLTQPGVIVYYLRLVFWPHPLCLDYAWPVARTARAVIPAALVVVLLLASTLWAFRRRPWIGLAGAWFFLILAPTSSVIPIKDPLVEHRMYLPLAAVVLLVVTGAHYLVKRVFGGDASKDLLRVSVSMLLLVGWVSALGYGTVRRNKDYRSELTMWRDVVAKRPNNPRAHMNLGGLLPESEAADAYRTAIRLQPDYADAHYNLGRTLFGMGETEQAMESYREALRHDPMHASAGYNLANALAERGKLKEAVALYRKVVEFNPKHAKAYVNLGTALAQQGNLDEAIEAFREAVVVDPEFADAHYNLGYAFALKGMKRQAVDEFRNTLSLQSDHGPARQSLEAILAKPEG